DARHAAVLRRRSDPRLGVLGGRGAGQRPGAEAELRRRRSRAVPGRQLGALRPADPGCAGARDLREPQPHVADTALGRRRGAARRHPGDLRRQPRGVRQVRARRRHALQRQLRGAAARRLLVGLERAQPGGLADAAVGSGPAQRQEVRRGGAGAVPQAPPERLAGAGRHRSRQRHDPRGRDRAAGRAQRPRHRAVDRRAEVRPPHVLPRRQPQHPQGLRGAGARLPRRFGELRRPESRPVPGDGLRPSPVRAADAAGPALVAGRLGLDRRPRQAQPRTDAHLPPLRPEDAVQARRAAVPHGVRLPDQARPLRRQRRLVQPPGRVDQPGRVHGLQEPQRAHHQPVSARRRRARRGRDVPERQVAHVPERAAAARRAAQAVLQGLRHADPRQGDARAPRPLDDGLRDDAPGRARGRGARPGPVPQPRFQALVDTQADHGRRPAPLLRDAPARERQRLRADPLVKRRQRHRKPARRGHRDAL
ncbi:MAG: GH5, partial [uncultured Solirubrobacteraceae bacterium]